MNANAKITVQTDGTLTVPDQPVIPFIEGDGIGPDIWRATRLVIDRAVTACFGGRRQIAWLEVLAGEKGFQQTGEWLPEETLDTIREHVVAIKGPMTTPVGKGIRSVNVAIRQKLDLYACVRPVKYIENVPSPMKHPEKIDMVIFRENTEDLYAGIEWQAGSPEAGRVSAFLESEMGVRLPPGAGIGIKPISAANTKRLVARAIAFAIANGKPSVTLMHKGNIMKFTEGAFNQWGYEVAREEVRGPDPHRDRPLGALRRPGADGQSGHQGPHRGHALPAGAAAPRGVCRDRDPESERGLSLRRARRPRWAGWGWRRGPISGTRAPSSKPPTGTAPKYAGLDKVNPSSLILSGAMMLEHMGWREAADRIRQALQATIREGTVTYDLARQIQGAREVRCSEFAARVAEILEAGSAG